MHFIKKLKKVLRETGTHLIVGLDTDVNRIPKFLLSFDNPILEFNKVIVDATKEHVCGYKLNSAFYESYGVKGWEAMKETLKLIPENLITIADIKRGDIENTTEHYAKAFLDSLGFDAVTAQPYMGQDSVRPFLRRKNKFVFVLALTSNYGYKDFQLLKVGQKLLWEVVMEKAHKWNEEKIGFVIGASHIKELKKITEKYPDVPLLIPGIGAQKGSTEKMLESLKHKMWVVNLSRSIIYCKPNAKDVKELFDAVKEAVVNSTNKLIYR